MSRRILTVSVRLPVTATVEQGTVSMAPALGGLATGFAAWHRETGGRWIGWPGALPADAPREPVNARLESEGLIPVHFSEQEVADFYHGFANRVLWPLHHLQLDRVPVDAAGWDAYVAANQRFADVIAERYETGDLVWIHDYHLMLVPQFIRERIPSAAIGFFLHIPFPSSEVFRVLPWRAQVLRGLLGADVIGVQTHAYMRHLLTSLLHVHGLEPDLNVLRVEGRRVEVGVFPMGVDARAIAGRAVAPDTLEEVERIRQEAGDRQIMLGVDQLDYTKGLPRRLEAIERLFAADPALAERVRYIQVAMPARTAADVYDRFVRDVEQAIGRINGRFGTIGSAPVHFVHRALSPTQLTALYRAADVMLVTPLRDGMNLVAKEYVAAREDGAGALLLSEFAGAAAELDGALVVNPYDVDALTAGMRRALAMPESERRARMTKLRRRVHAQDVRAWADQFLGRLEGHRSRSPRRRHVMPPLMTLQPPTGGTPVCLLLDYDGTLVPIARTPGLARPDEALLDLLRAVCALPDTRVEIVSGRPREVLEEWLGGLPLGLWAEHGFWHRASGATTWEAAAVSGDGDWFAPVRAIFEEFCAATPGSQIEVKSASIAWHYRRASRDFGERQAHELRLLLGDTLSNRPLEVIEGKKVIEVRFHGVNKGLVGQRIRGEVPAGTRVVAIGDDVTDEDLFAALADTAVTVSVGSRSSLARYSVEDHRQVRRLLGTLLPAAVR